MKISEEKKQEVRKDMLTDLGLIEAEESFEAIAAERERDEMLRVSNSMRKYGGGFVQALGAALLVADSDNTQRIKSAFPEYWDKYSRLSEGSTGDATDEASVEEYEKDHDGHYRSENDFDMRNHYREM